MLAAIVALALSEALSPSAGQAFDRLMALQGEWREVDSTRPMTIRYSVTAGGSAIVETWRSPSGRETMTVYSVDSDALIATHYCAQGNQPTLVMTALDDTLSFGPRSITGLDADEGRLEQLRVTPSTDHFDHVETYANDEGLETTQRRFVRIAP